MQRKKMRNSFGNGSKTVLSFIGIGLVIAMVGSMWYWETYGREKFLYKKIIVLNQPVNGNTVITPNMVEDSYYEQSTLMDNAITDKYELKDKMANHYIPAHTPLTIQYFSNSTFKLSSNQEIMKIPSAWIDSVPDSIRRGDKISICPFIGSQNTNTNPTTSNTINTYNEQQADAIKNNAGAELFSTNVAYVKDANNKEIVDTSSDDRLDGSAKIDSIEIVINKDQVPLLKNSYESGNKFVILYKR